MANNGNADKYRKITWYVTFSRLPVTQVYSGNALLKKKGETREAERRRVERSKGESRKVERKNYQQRFKKKPNPVAQDSRHTDLTKVLNAILPPEKTTKKHKEYTYTRYQKQTSE